MIRIGLVQAASHESATQNLKSLRSFVQQAQHAHCDVICFPECFLTGYAPERVSELALDTDSPILDNVSSVAQEFQIDLLVGYMEYCNGKSFITHGIFKKDCSRLFYHKSHLGSKERNFFTSGDSLDVFDLSCGLRIGFQLCVETHFPEITQTLSLRGADIIFAPHAVPRISGDRAALWEKYIPARSYDNRVYFACCNQWDKERFAGGCLVTDPRGDVVSSYFEDSAYLLVCDIDPKLAAKYRPSENNSSKYYFPAKRRKELYD
ncbi:MAG: hypothetical protein IJ955_07855 [Oscillospiraceae bacterium]|nr:hypothetical protein [Oscillospiraceae bacterium]